MSGDGPGWYFSFGFLLLGIMLMAWVLFWSWLEKIVLLGIIILIQFIIIAMH
jgi:hypothetical protein